MKKLYNFVIIFLVACTATMCDSFPVDINVQQSINNLSSDTIVIINSKKEFKGIDISTIICYPFSKKIFYNNTHKKQPLEPYDFPLVYESSSIVTSSGRLLIKDIINKSNWNFDKQANHEWLSFTIEETDLGIVTEW